MKAIRVFGLKGMIAINGNTIAAIATGQAVGGIGVVRISGRDAFEIADRVFCAAGEGKLSELPGYRARYGKVIDSSGWEDEAVALIFRAPHSYTGEDVVELSCHGGLTTTRCTLEACLAAGARLAQPGEFSQRAFLNGKMSLDQAEAVMAIVNAQSRQAAKAAMRARAGAATEKIEGICSLLKSAAARLAVAEEFPDEIDYELDTNELKRPIMSALESLRSVRDNAGLGKLLREGIETVIVGKPNVGKSTLMNLLAGCERSIVTNVPGTTRDIVEESIMLGDCPLRLSDTAGIHDTEDPVEAIGVERARTRLLNASLAIAVFDGSDVLTQEDKDIIETIKNIPTIAVINKNDKKQNIDIDYLHEKIDCIVMMSASAGDGLDRLEKAITEKTKLDMLDPAENILTNTRQQNCVMRAIGLLEEVLGELDYDESLAGLKLRDAISALLELTGADADDEIINEIFSSFCVGK